ncbi:MAG: amidohydrolase [Candidatus Dormiibacterota bacterium]
MSQYADTTSTLYTGCEPSVLCDREGRIVAIGPEAKARAGGEVKLVEVEGRALPGLGDTHIHLDELVLLRVGLDLRATHSRQEVLDAVRVASRSTAPDGWIIGRGWNYSAWPQPQLPNRHDLDEAGEGRPVLLASKDEHSVWVSSSALQRAGIGKETPDPVDGVIDREPEGNPSGILREAWKLFAGMLPRPDPVEYQELLASVLSELARLGLCTLHTMDPSEALFALQCLAEEDRLPLRVVVNLPVDNLGAAQQLGIRTGWGDARLRVWGIKAFVDGSLGSRTAEMLDGSGVARILDPALEDLIERCRAAELNLCLHAIGDGAVHRALVALERHAGAWPGWRPRIEHAQCVDPDDIPRFLRAGAIASMQPIHAVADRTMADSVWGKSAANAYAWGRLADAGVPLAFGSDAPVESPDPLLGIDAATGWRSRVGWYPELALSEAGALDAYTVGVAFAAGLERECGRLAPGYRCDLTVVNGDRVVATVVDGRLVYGLGMAVG